MLLDEGADVSALDKVNRTPAAYLPSVGSEPLAAALQAPPLHPHRPFYLTFLDRQPQRQEVEKSSSEESIVESINESAIVNHIDSPNDSANPSNSTLSQLESLNDPISSLLPNEMHHSNNNNAIDHPITPDLVLWPPVKQQKQFPSNLQPPLRLCSSETVLMCISSIEVDIFPLLLESGLVELLDLLGLQGLIICLLITLFFLLFRCIHYLL
jgi:hypothetical protein